MKPRPAPSGERLTPASASHSAELNPFKLSGPLLVFLSPGQHFRCTQLLTSTQNIENVILVATSLSGLRRKLYIRRGTPCAARMYQLRSFTSASLVVGSLSPLLVYTTMAPLIDMPLQNSAEYFYSLLEHFKWKRDASTDGSTSSGGLGPGNPVAKTTIGIFFGVAALIFLFLCFTLWCV